MYCHLTTKISESIISFPVNMQNSAWVDSLQTYFQCKEQLPTFFFEGMGLRIRGESNLGGN